MLDRETLLSLLDELLLTHSPSGHEHEIDRLLLPHFQRYMDEVRQDGAGNIIGLVRGESPGDALGLLTHKDELGMMVKRVLPDGKLKLETTSSAQPWIYGEGPVDVLGAKETVQGVLSFGARHVSSASSGVHAGKDGRLPSWEQVWVSTGLSRAELADRGVDIGTPAVIGRHRKTPTRIGECIGGYGLDCKGSLAILISVMAGLGGRRPKRDLYVVATAREEEGVIGGSYVARTLGLAHAVAVEVCPVAAEYETANCGRPVLLYKDAAGVYDSAGNRALVAAAASAGVDPQKAVLSSFGSDASLAVKYGQLPRGNCIGFPTENTHGYELASIAGIMNTARVLMRFVEMECDL